MKNHVLSIFKVIVVSVIIGLPIMFFSFKVRENKKPTPYNVTIINKYWAKFHLQVRVGNNSNPESNAIFYDKVLLQNQSLPVPYEVFCWYRRDSNPNNPDGVHFTNWTSTGCFANSPCTVDNP